MPDSILFPTEDATASFLAEEIQRAYKDKVELEIQRAYKVEIDPNNEQRTTLRCHAGCSRWAYNWGLQRKIEVYKATKKSVSAIDLHKELNKLKEQAVEDGGVPWMYAVSKCAPQEALRDLDKAFQSFFRNLRKPKPKAGKSGKSKRRKNPLGFPQFKSKHKSPLKFRLTGAIAVSDGCIQLPRLGSIRLKERNYLPLKDREDVKVQSAALSERAGRWFVSLSCKVTVPDSIPQPRTKVVGIDVGIKSLAVTSDGRVFENPRAWVRTQRRLRRAAKVLSRRVKGSQNRLKAKRRVAELYYRAACIRQDALHKATTSIVRSADVVCIESLNVSGMMQNHKLARSLSDVSLAEFLRQIRYKASWAGVSVFEADRFYPSSKTCSSCGSVKSDLTLSDRTYRCTACGFVQDRDMNAAMNLAKLAPSSEVLACGEAVRPAEHCSAGMLR